MLTKLQITEKARITVTRDGTGAFSALHVQIQGYTMEGTVLYDKSYIDYGGAGDFKLIIEVPEPK